MAAGQWVSSASFPAQRLVGSSTWEEWYTAWLTLRATFHSLFFFMPPSLSSRGLIQFDKGKLSSSCGLSGLRRIKTSEITQAQPHCLAKHYIMWVCENTESSEMEGERVRYKDGDKNREREKERVKLQLSAYLFHRNSSVQFTHFHRCCA